MRYESQATPPAGEQRRKRTQATVHVQRDQERPKISGSLAATLQMYQEQSGRSIYQLSNLSGVDSAYIWRILRGERQNVSREVLLLLSLALAVESNQAEKVIEVANDLFEAAGFNVR